MTNDNKYEVKESSECEGFCYRSRNKTILFKMEFSPLTLSADELIEYICDSLTHEHIHKLLHRLFNITVCKLFDSIEGNFRNVPLQKKYFDDYNKLPYVINRHTYKDDIVNFGFSSFLQYYNIDIHDCIQANIICNHKMKK